MALIVTIKIVLMNQIQQTDPVFEKLFAQIQPEVKETLTLEQVAAIQRAFGSENWTRRHPLDLRVTLPIPGLRFYIVLLAGEEKRSKQRLQYTKVLYPLWTPSNIIFLLGLFSILSICTVATLYSLSSIFHLRDTSAPTSIPWIFNQSECEYTGRTWSDGKCWDYKHDPSF